MVVCLEIRLWCVVPVPVTVFPTADPVPASVGGMAIVVRETNRTCFQTLCFDHGKRKISDMILLMMSLFMAHTPLAIGNEEGAA
jgi:hypothetical protein